MKIKTFVVSAFQQNARIVYCEKTRLAVCIDPGAEAELFADFLQSNELRLQSIALTHAHIDHIGAVYDLHKIFPQTEIVLHKDDEQMYLKLPEQPLGLGVPRAAWAQLGLEFDAPPPLSRYFADGEIFRVGEIELKVLHTPGHSPGHVIFFAEAHRTAIVGDTLFAGSIGRTDLPGGSLPQLLDSIHTKILPLGDEVKILNGHGADTTIEREKRFNPFLRN